MNREQLIAAGFTDEQADKILALHDADIDGLKSKNEALINKEKELKAKLSETSAATEEARKVAAEKEEARLKAEGDISGLKKLYEKQLADATAASKADAEKHKAALMSRDKNAAIQQILSKVDDGLKLFAETTLSNMIDVSYSDQGDINYAFKSGDAVIADNVNSFLEYAKKDASWQNVLLAEKTNDIVTSGDGITTGSARAAKNFTDMSLEEKVAYIEKQG